MKLGQLIEQLSYGELKDLNIGGGGKGNIPPNARNKVISYINGAMRRVYEDFPMKTKEIIVGLQDDISLYTLSREYAKSNTESSIPVERRYIEDSIYEPFLDDIQRIDDIFNGTGREQDVNNRANAIGVFTVGYNQIQVALPKRGEKLTIVYSAVPQDIPNCACDTYDIDIPLMFSDVLRAFVAYLAYSNMSTQTGAQKAGEYGQKYELLKVKLQEKNVLNTYNTAYNLRFHRGGFV